MDTKHTSLIDRLRLIHLAEVTQLSASVAGEPAHPPRIISMVFQYGKHIYSSWIDGLKNIVFFSYSPVDLIVYCCFAFGSSTILAALLICCIICNVPEVKEKIEEWSQRYGSGLSPVNAPSNIFRRITEPQVHAAKEALKQAPVEPKVAGQRTFNLDIARLLLQLAALMYERGTEPINAALTEGRALGIFPSITVKNRDLKFLSRMTSLRQNGSSIRPSNFTGAIALQAIDAKLHHNSSDGAILKFCHTFNLNYAAVSDLNTCNSAYAALFWDPSSNWIVLAFKGTSPTEFTEWVTDFHYPFVEAGDWLPGFCQVHGICFITFASWSKVSLGGFMERIFPSDVSKTRGVRPWDTIMSGIKSVAEDLRNKIPDPKAKIYLYLTGHSLGCAIASLAFARLVLVEKDLGEHIVLRDGYMFAAPIVCDAASVRAFNGEINKDYAMPKTLWRVTNMEDIVATGLPDFGDNPNSRFSSNSLLNFAHLGAEIKLRSEPEPCQVEGEPHITRGIPVLINSSLSRSDTVATSTANEGFPEILSRMERIPFFGRLVQHAAFCYWDQLQRVGTGLCQWCKKD